MHPCKRWRAARRTVGLAALALACGRDPVDPTPGGLAPIATLGLRSPRDTLLVADTVRIGVDARDSAGNALSPSLTWTSDAPSVARVSASGVVTALDRGAATITAIGGGQRASIALVVRKIAYSVNVTPDAVCLRKGFTARLTLQALDSLGQPLPPGIRPAAWRSSNELIARVAALPGDSALVSGLAAGDVVITGTLMGLSDATPFFVDPTPLGRPLVCHG